MESSSDILYLNTYSAILNQSQTVINASDRCDYCTDVKNYHLVLPDTINENTSNPNIEDLISKHGCQMNAFRFYVNDNSLTNYEEFFNDNKSGIIPLSIAIDYFKNKQK